MKKNVLVYALFALLLICIMVSCNSNTTKPQEVIAKSPATLKVNYFRQYYAVGPTDPTKLEGTLSYTAEGGSKIETIDIKNEAVTKTGFDTSKVSEGNTLKLTYKGIDVVVTYNVYNVEKVDLYGEFIVSDNTTLYFNKDGKTGTKYTWASFDNFYNSPGEPAPEKKEFTYTPDVSSSGRTVVRVDGWGYYPDGNGGLHSYPSSDQYFEDGSKYVPDMYYFYVSTGPEDEREKTNEAARNKYLVMNFDLYGNAFIWFVTKEVLNNTADLRAYAIEKNAIKVSAEQMSFGLAGVSFSKVTGTEGSKAPTGANKNLTALMNKDGYDSTERAFSFVSYSDSDADYNGYNYIMKLSNISIQ